MPPDEAEAHARVIRGRRCGRHVQAGLAAAARPPSPPPDRRQPRSPIFTTICHLTLYTILIYNKLADLMTRWDVESGKCAGGSLYSRHMPDSGYFVHAMFIVSRRNARLSISIREPQAGLDYCKISSD